MADTPHDNHSGAGVPDTRLGGLPGVTYGHLFGEPEDLPHLRGTGRSGLSPTFFSGPNERFSPPDNLLPLFEAERMYQKMKLSGYTTSTLHAMGALQKPRVQIPNLENDVHPMFDKPMWTPRGASLVNLDYGLEGRYEIHNPLVWDAMLPSLRLASRFLKNAHCWPWWDALVNGEQRWIDEPLAGEDDPKWSFHVREPEVVLNEGIILDEEFIEKYNDRIRFQFQFANADWQDAETGKSTHANIMGYTQYLRHPIDIARITISTQVVGPLLRNDISAPGRLVLQFQIAKTILHEFAHAIGFVQSADEGILEYGEPYFEDQAIAELGESMETAVWGGRMWCFPSNVRERAFIMTTVSNWPNYAILAERAALGLTRQILPGAGGIIHVGAEQNVMAIPLSWMEALFQNDFWEIYVRQFGGDAVRPYPRLLMKGSVITAIRGREVSRTETTKFGEDYIAYMASKYSREVEMGGSAVASLAHRMDGERVAEAYRQCAILEQAMAWYYARTGVPGEA